MFVFQVSLKWLSPFAVLASLLCCWSSEPYRTFIVVNTSFSLHNGTDENTLAMFKTKCDTNHSMVTEDTEISLDCDELTMNKICEEFWLQIGNRETTGLLMFPTRIQDIYDVRSNDSRKGYSECHFLYCSKPVEPTFYKSECDISTKYWVCKHYPIQHNISYHPEISNDKSVNENLEKPANALGLYPGEMELLKIISGSVAGVTLFLIAIMWLVYAILLHRNKR